MSTLITTVVEETTEQILRHAGVTKRVLDAKVWRPLRAKRAPTLVHITHSILAWESDTDDYIMTSCRESFSKPTNWKRKRGLISLSSFSQCGRKKGEGHLSFHQCGGSRLSPALTYIFFCIFPLVLETHLFDNYKPTQSRTPLFKQVHLLFRRIRWALVLIIHATDLDLKD